MVGNIAINMILHLLPPGRDVNKEVASLADVCEDGVTFHLFEYFEM